MAPSACACARPILLIFIRQRAHMQEQQKRGREGGESVDFDFSFPAHVMSEFRPHVCALAKACRAGFAPALSDSYLLDERARTGRIKSKEGGVIIFFSFFFECVRVDVRILTALAQAKAPVRSQGGQNSPFSF